MKLALMLVPLALGGMLAAQTPHMVRASGEAVVAVKPDQVKVTVGVETQAATAQAAAEQNSTIAGNVLSALRGVLGSSGLTETVSYTISPNYRNSSGQPAVLVGYTVVNMIEVTSFDLSSVGRLIDAASGAGANRIQSLSFGIRDEDPVRRQALTAAAKMARGRAEAIAAGLGGRVGMVLNAEESSAVRPLTENRVAVTAGSTTPIETGLVEVRAQVIVEMEYIAASA